MVTMNKIIDVYIYIYILDVEQDKLIQKWENITKVPKPIIQVDEIYFNEHLCHACYENHYVIHLSYFYTFHHDWFMSMPHHAM